MRTEEALEVMIGWQPPVTTPERVVTAIEVLIGAGDFYVRGITRQSRDCTNGHYANGQWHTLDCKPLP